MLFPQCAPLTFPISDIPSPAETGDVPKVTRVGTFSMSSASSGRDKFLRLWVFNRAWTFRGFGEALSNRAPCVGCAGGGCEDPRFNLLDAAQMLPSAHPRSSKPAASLGFLSWHATRQEESMGDSPHAARGHRLVRAGEGGIEGHQGAAPKNVADTGESGRFLLVQELHNAPL